MARERAKERSPAESLEGEVDVSGYGCWMWIT